jgi:hypothetical protein
MYLAWSKLIILQSIKPAKHILFFVMLYAKRPTAGVTGAAENQPPKRDKKSCQKNAGLTRR